MAFLKYKKIKKTFLLFAIMIYGLINCQVHIIDSETKHPIQYVTAFSTKGNNVTSAISDERGLIDISKIDEGLINFIHNEYKEFQIEKNKIKDTIYLNPIIKTFNIQEVVINKNQQKDFIDKLLIEIVKNKNLNYSKSNTYSNYQYKTFSLTASSGYAFESNGLLKIQNNNAYIDPIKNFIKYKDNTAGPDFSNLQKMIYDDFLEKFDEKFLKNYSFIKNFQYNIDDNSTIMLLFNSKKYGEEDKGYIIIDTTSKAIIEFQRISSTNYNLKERTSSIYRNFLASVGQEYKELPTNILITFKKIDKFYQPTFIRFKTVVSIKRKKEITFNSSESELSLNYLNISNKGNWLFLPEPYYIMGIMSKKTNEQYQALQKINAEHKNFVIK